MVTCRYCGEPQDDRPFVFFEERPVIRHPENDEVEVEQWTAWAHLDCCFLAAQAAPVEETVEW